MVQKEELRQIVLFQDLPEETLEKIQAIAEIENFEPGTVLFGQDEQLQTFYLLLKGRVRLTRASSAGVALTLGEVLPGGSFGVSSFIPETRSSSSAFCVESCRVITLSKEKLMPLFQEDPLLGYTIMLRVVQLFKSRMNQRTEQFLRSLTRHPAVKSALKQ